MSSIESEENHKSRCRMAVVGLAISKTIEAARLDCVSQGFDEPTVLEVAEVLASKSVDFIRMRRKL